MLECKQLKAMIVRIMSVPTSLRWQWHFETQSAFRIWRTEVVELVPERRSPSRGSQKEIPAKILPASLRLRASRTAPGEARAFRETQEFPLESRDPGRLHRWWTP